MKISTSTVLNPVKIKDTTNLTQLFHLSFIVLSHGLLFFNLLSKAYNKRSIISPHTLTKIIEISSLRYHKTVKMDKMKDNILEC